MACAANIWPPVHLNCYKQRLTASSNCCHSFLLKSNAKRRCLIFSFGLDNGVCWLNSVEPSMKQSCTNPCKLKRQRAMRHVTHFLLIINNKTEQIKQRSSSVRKRDNTQNKTSLHQFNFTACFPLVINHTPAAALYPRF